MDGGRKQGWEREKPGCSTVLKSSANPTGQFGAGWPFRVVLKSREGAWAFCVVPLLEGGCLSPKGA